jgi:photosystem II stability/assembly factor-like uncharacterized protein
MRKNQILIDELSDQNIIVGKITTIEGDLVRKATVRVEAVPPYETTPWTAGVGKAVGDRVVATVDNNHEYRCLESGTTGGNEPTWPTDGGAIDDGVDIIWQDMGIYDAGNLLEHVRFYYHCSPGSTDDGYQAFNVCDNVLVIEEGAAYYIVGFEDLKPRACEKVILAGTHPSARILRSIDEGQTWEDIGSLYNPNYVLYTGTWSKSYTMGEAIIGSISLAQGIILGMLPNNYLIFKYTGDPTKKFIASDSVLGVSSGATSICSSVVINHDYGVSELAGMGDTGIVIGGIYSSLTLAGNIARSTNKGLVWTDLGVILGAHDIYSLEYLGEGVCLAGTNPMGRVLKSTDFGLNWTDKGTLDTLTPACVTDFTNVGDGICLASTYWEDPNWKGSIFRSTDWGSTWVKVFATPSGNLMWIESVCYLESGICLAGGGWGGLIYRSTDYGVNWAYINPLPYGLYVVEFEYLGNGICLAGINNSTTANLHRSTDYGLNWTDLGTLFGLTHIYALEYLGGGKCLLGGEPGAKIIRSTDYGLNWSDMGNQFGEDAINTIARLGA